MTRSVYTTLLLGAAVIAISACSSSKGPGALGSKNDIVVRNNGMPGANTEAPLPPSSGGDAAISSTVESVEPNPAAAVETPEALAAPVTEQQPLPSTEPAVEQAVQQADDANAPVPATTTTPMNDGTAASTAPATDTVPADIVAPAPVTQEQTTPVQTPAPAPAAAPVSSAPPVGTPIETPSATGAPIVPDDAPAAAVEALGARKVSPSSVYPAEDYPPEALVDQAAPSAVSTTPAPVAAPAPSAAPSVPAEGPYSYKPLPSGSTYNADPNAPYSPSAASANTAVAPSSVAPAVPTVSGGLSDPATIKAAQAALKLKGVYSGAETGTIDAAFLNALTKYQGDNGLPMGGLNTETLRSLGIIQ